MVCVLIIWPWTLVFNFVEFTFFTAGVMAQQGGIFLKHHKKIKQERGKAKKIIGDAKSSQPKGTPTKVPFVGQAPLSAPKKRKKKTRTRLRSNFLTPLLEEVLSKCLRDWGRQRVVTLHS